MIRPFHPARKPTFAFAGILLLAGGCGLSDYEAKLLEEQERMKYVDEENKMLGDPIQLPVIKTTGKPRTPVVIFFRAPKGIPASPEPTPLGNYMFRYAKPSGTASPNPAAAQDNGIREVYLGATQDVKADEFRKDVVAVLPGVDSQSLKPSAGKQAPGRDHPLKFVTASGTDGENIYTVYFCEEDRYQVAVIFKAEGAKMSTAKPIIEYSVQSLAVGPAATELASRRALAQSRPLKPK